MYKTIHMSSATPNKMAALPMRNLHREGSFIAPAVDLSLP
jgi:hypothetical protein